MSDRANNPDRQAELLSKAIDEQLSEDEASELSRLLASDELNRNELIEDISLHASLAWHKLTPRPFSVEELLVIEKERKKDRQLSNSGKDTGLTSWLFPLLCVAALLMLAFVGFQNLAQSPHSQIATRKHDNETHGELDAKHLQPIPEVIAVIVDAVGTNTNDFLGGEKSLLANETLEIESGLVELRFLAGASAVLNGPARMKIQGPKEIALDIGKLSVRMDENENGFIVKTPDGRVRDLGTAFGVNVSRTGSSEVAVYDGEVDVSGSSQAAPFRKVMAGQSVTLHRSGKVSEVKEFDEEDTEENFTLNKPDYRIEAYKDAFVRGGDMVGLGENRNYGSEHELHVKFDSASVRYNRRTWIGFDISEIPRQRIIGARFTMAVLPNELAERIEPSNKERDTNWSFEVSGLWDVFYDAWTEAKITWLNAPGNAAKVVSGRLAGPQAPSRLGKFTIHSRGTRGDVVEISSLELLNFLKSDEDGRVTVIVSRLSSLIKGRNDRVIHGFASREHPVLPPPTLELWCSTETEPTAEQHLIE